MLNEHGSRVNAIADGAVTPHEMAQKTVTEALSRISKKWRLHVLWSVSERPQRFNELLKSDETMSSFMLAQALRELEGNGLVVRRVVPSRPPCTAYQASESGQEFLASLAPLLTWASRRAAAT